MSSLDHVEFRAHATRGRTAVSGAAPDCPHYLSFMAEEIPSGVTQFKYRPPIRKAGNRELLWRGLAEGSMDCIVSDHSPCTAELKRLDTGAFGVAWGGIASLQLGLLAVWTEVRRRGDTLIDAVRWTAENPLAKSVSPPRGHIALGYAADLMVFAPDEVFAADKTKLHHKNLISAYDGLPLAGVVRSSWLAAERINLGENSRGRLLARGAPDLGANAITR
jgi:allantoinase